MAAAILVVGGISAATVALTTHAQSSNSNSANSNGIGWGKMGHMGQGVSGTVTAINGNTITLNSNNTTYTVDATNAQVSKFANNTKTTITVSSIAVGDTLRVTGTVSGTNVTATNIIDGTLPDKQNMPARPQPAANGTITAISGNTITLNGSNNTTYSVDASNAEISIIKKAGTSLQNSGVQIGDTLQVFGTVSGNNIIATKIMDGSFPQGAGHDFGMAQPNQ